MGVNISQSAIAGNCDNKCSYLVGNYLSMDPVSCVHTKYSINISCPSEVSYAIFNQQKFTLAGIDLHISSYFTYNDAKAPAELMIVHIGSNPNQRLFVVIPIQYSTSAPSSKSKTIMENWIQTTASYAPALNATTSQGLESFNVLDLIPKSSFYFLDSANSNIPIVIFNINDAIIISQDTYTSLESLITPNVMTFGKDPSLKLFYNSKGVKMSTTTSMSSNDIYIDCQPTDSSQEEVGIEKQNYSSNDFKVSLHDLQNSTFIIAISSIVVFIIVLYGLNSGMKYLKS